eukprot:scaffold114596_cov17-Prasinocladus_malaysianus.AAC.1
MEKANVCIHYHKIDLPCGMAIVNAALGWFGLAHYNLCHTPLRRRSCERLGKLQDYTGGYAYDSQHD